jgi:hypothetical protein
MSIHGVFAVVGGGFPDSPPTVTVTNVPRSASIPLDDLNTFAGNPRRGVVDAIAASLTQNGQYKPIVVNQGTHTGRPNEVLAGNHTLAAARQLGWTELDVWLVDVDTDDAKRIVLADNRTAEIGGFDTEDLLDLLGSLPDLGGTGYTETDLTALTELVAGPPDLDDLHDDVGDPLEEDNHTVVRLLIEPDLAAVWAAHRRSFDTDTAALRAALNL